MAKPILSPSGKTSTAAIAEIFFTCAYSAQTIRPSAKLTHERHILGMSTSFRNDSHCSKSCRLSCTPITSTNRKYPFQLFLGPVKPLCRNVERQLFCWMDWQLDDYVFYLLPVSFSAEYVKPVFGQCLNSFERNSGWRSKWSVCFALELRSDKQRFHWFTGGISAVLYFGKSL